MAAAGQGAVGAEVLGRPEGLHQEVGQEGLRLGEREERGSEERTERGRRSGKAKRADGTSEAG